MKAMPGLKIFLDSGDLQPNIGFVPSNDTLENKCNLSFSPFVHGIKRFHAINVFTDFIDKNFG